MPALANIEVIWVIIIIFSVIAQVIKGARKVASKAPPTRTPGSARPPDGRGGSFRETPSGHPATGSGANARKEYVAPEDALQEFLRSLTGAPAPTAKPARPEPVVKAVTPPARRPAPKRPARTEAPSSAAAARSHRDRTDTGPSPAVQLESEAFAVSPAAVLARRIRADLHGDRESLRRAVVLRELLGPPLAWRSSARTDMAAATGATGQT